MKRYKCKYCGTNFLSGLGRARHEETECLKALVEDSKKGDAVNHPAHYTTHPSGVECIVVTEHMNFCRGSAMKYLWRADFKGGVEDLKKARWFLDREIARLEKGTK